MQNRPTFVPATKAAKILDCEVAKVHELADQGLLRRKIKGDLALIHTEDLEEIYRLQLAGALKPGEMVRRLLFLEQKVLRLEAAVNMLYEVNQLKGSRFEPMADYELHQVYADTMDALGAEEWSRDRLIHFGELFVRLTEVEFDQLNQVLQIDESWIPFFQLCLKQLRWVGLSEELETDAELQQIRDLLSHGSKNLRTVAVLMIRHKAELGPSRELLHKMAAADIESFDTLARQLTKRTPGTNHLKLL